MSTQNIEGKATGKKERVIFHMDGDAFFVGVEVAKNPALRGLPVVTGEERGIVSALSYEAKALGIVRGMPIFRLKKNFPQVIIMPGDYRSYAAYSRAMFDIVRRYADVVEEYSIDECFADLTGLDRTFIQDKCMTYLEIAERIKSEISSELNLSVSVGIAPTKVLAKAASKWVKPDGLTVIEPERAREFLAAIPIGKVWGIGPRTARVMQQKGVVTAGDFAEQTVGWVREHFSKPYEVLWRELKGEAVMRVDAEQKTEYKSIQKTRTFHPATNDRHFLLSELSKHIEDACRKARRYDLAARHISFFLKTTYFHYAGYSAALLAPTNAPEPIVALALEHLADMLAVHGDGVLYRTTGVTLHELVPASLVQEDLFGALLRSEDLARKFKVVHECIDVLEEKQGQRLVHLASSHASLLRKKKGTNEDDLDRDLLFL